MIGAPKMDADDWGKLHFACGMMLGLAHKHGVVDVTIYYNGVRIRIEQAGEANGRRDPGEDKRDGGRRDTPQVQSE